MLTDHRAEYLVQEGLSYTPVGEASLVRSAYQEAKQRDADYSHIFPRFYVYLLNELLGCVEDRRIEIAIRTILALWHTVLNGHTVSADNWKLAARNAWEASREKPLLLRPNGQAERDAARAAARMTETSPLTREDMSNKHVGHNSAEHAAGTAVRLAWTAALKTTRRSDAKAFAYRMGDDVGKWRFKSDLERGRIGKMHVEKFIALMNECPSTPIA